MRPCTGRLLLIEPTGRPGCVTRATGGAKLTPATVWVHCGLHYQLEQTGDEMCTPPSPGNMPPMLVPGSGYRFLPLPRNDAGGTPATVVTAFLASASGELSRIQGRWVVEVALHRDPHRLLRFCAASQADALAWQRQLRMRTAPLWVVWARHVGVVGGGSATGDAVGPTPVGAAPTTSLTALSGLTQGARRALAEGVAAGVAGVATSLANPEAHDVAVACGPLVSTALATLTVGLKVIVAVREVGGAVAEAATDLQAVMDACAQTLLPALKDVDVSSVVSVGDLLERLSSLVAGVEEAAGEMHHLMRSRRERWWRACSTVCRGWTVGRDLEERMSHITKEARDVTALVPIEQLRVLMDAPRQAAMRAATKYLPELPPNVFTQWDDPMHPATRLHSALMTPGTASCVAVGAQGMGGVGKTVCCMLVAHRLALEEEGRKRFDSGVHWVQLYQRISPEQVLKCICALATTLMGAVVDAVDLDMAVNRLNEALEGKHCLVVVDDVWDHRWADLFFKALDGRAGSSLLFSTRQKAFAARWHGIVPVTVTVLSGAAAAGVLYKHANAAGAVDVDEPERLVAEAVELCGGLALALAVMGALVRKVGWKAATKEVRDDPERLISEPVEGQQVHISLRACLRASRWALGDDEEDRERCWKRFLALCVVASKEQVPVAGLAALWEAETPAVQIFARELQACSLVTLQGGVEGVGDRGPLLLSLHDLVVDFLRSDRTQTTAERGVFNRTLVSGYCRAHGIAELTAGSSTSGAVRELWKLPMDNFIQHALPRLLRDGGAAEELKLLPFVMQYIAWRVEVSGGTCGLYREECRPANMDVLDRVATVVEGAMTDGRVSLWTRLQQAAFEVAERFGPGLQPTVSGASCPLLASLYHSARSFVQKPALELIAGPGLDPRAERRVFRSDSPVACMCTVTFDSRTNVVFPTHNGCLMVLDEDTGSQVARLEGHTDSVGCIAVVNNGTGGNAARVVSGSGDSTLRVWDVAEGTCVGTLTGHTSHILCVAVVHDGADGGTARVVSGSADKTLRVWDVAKGTCVATCTGHTDWVQCVAVVNDGADRGAARVVSGSLDGSLRVWDVAKGTCVATCTGHTDWVQCVAVVNDGADGRAARVVSGSLDGSLRVWDVAKGTCVAACTGHTNRVQCVAVVNDGADGRAARVVSGSLDGSLRVWDVAKGTCVATLWGHTNRVQCVAVVNDGEGGGGARVVSGSHDNTLRVWDVAKGTCVAILTGHTCLVQCVAAVNDGVDGRAARVVSGSRDKTVRVWVVAKGTCVATLAGHTGWIQCVAVVNDCAGGGAARVVLGSYDNTLRVWDVAKGTCVAILTGHTDWVRCVAVVNDGGDEGAARVVSGSADSTLRVWDVAKGTCVAILTGHTDWVWCVAVVNNGARGGTARVVSGSADKTLRVWDVAKGTCVAILTGHTGVVRCIAVVNDGARGGAARVVSGSWDKTLRVWDVAKGTCVAACTGHTNRVQCVAVVNDGADGRAARVVSGSLDGSLRVWDVAKGTCVATLWGHTNRVQCVAVVNDGEGGGGARVVSGSHDNTLRVWDVAKGTCVAILTGHTGLVQCVVAVKDGVDGRAARVVSGSWDSTLRVWDVAKGTCVATLAGHTGWVRCVAVVNDGGDDGAARVVSGSGDSTLRVWDVAKGTCVGTLAGHTSHILCVVVVHDGADGGTARVVSGSADKTLRVWDVAKGTCVAILTGHTDWVWCVAVVNNGARGGTARVVSGSADNTLRVWDVAKGTCVAILTGHTAAVRCIAAVNDGARGGAARVVSGSLDKTLRVWDVSNGTCLAVLDGVSSWASSFSGRDCFPSVHLPPGKRQSAGGAGGETSFVGFVDLDGRCALVGDDGRTFPYFCAPPRTRAVCWVSSRCAVFGTESGGVHVGRLIA